MSNNKEKKDLVEYIPHVLAGSAVLGLGAFLTLRYKTSLSNEWLVKTGLMVNDMEIGKKFFQLPFQNIQKITVTP